MPAKASDPKPHRPYALSPKPKRPEALNPAPLLWFAFPKNLKGLFLANKDPVEGGFVHRSITVDGKDDDSYRQS